MYGFLLISLPLPDRVYRSKYSVFSSGRVTCEDFAKFKGYNAVTATYQKLRLDRDFCSMLAALWKNPRSRLPYHESSY